MNLLQLLVAFQHEKTCEFTESFASNVSFFQVRLIFQRSPDVICLAESRECIYAQLSTSSHYLGFVIIYSVALLFNYEAYEI